MKHLKKSILIWMIALVSASMIIAPYIYNRVYKGPNNLLRHSRNLLTGSGIEKCQLTNSGVFADVKEYVCENGFYQKQFLGQKKIFYYYTRSDISAGVSSHIYFIDNADIETFKVLDSKTAVDKNIYYSAYAYGGSIREIPNPLGEVAINQTDAYTNDAESVYFRGERLQGSNPLDFKIVSDKKFEFGRQFTVSNGVVFYGSEVVEVKLGSGEKVNIDASTFWLYDMGDLSYKMGDKNYTFLFTNSGYSKLTAYPLVQKK